MAGASAAATFSITDGAHWALVRTLRQPQCGEALALDGAGGGDPLGDRARRLRRGGQDQVGGRDRRHVDADVDAVEQRPGDARLIIVDAARAAPADVAGLAGHAAAAGVHRGDQLDHATGS